MALAPRDPSRLRIYAQQVATPGTALYKRYLPKGAFREQFGPADATISTLSSALGSAGLSTSLSDNGLLLSFRGSASAVEAAFGTRLESARLASGKQVRLATRSISVPASLARSVTAVLGLSTLPPAASSLRRSPTANVVPSSGDARRRAAARAAVSLRPRACADARIAAHGGGPYNLPDMQGLTDQELAWSYGLGGLYQAQANGSGQRVAIFELEHFGASDLSTFSRCYFGQDLSSQVSVTTVLGGVLPGTVSAGEATLDVEDVLGFAPGAMVDVYEGPNTDLGVVATYNRIVQDDRAKAVTTSWGLCEEQSSIPAAEESIFEQAAVQGQTVVAASGDAGSNDCGSTPAQLSVDDPASQPYVLAAGGTTITAASRPPTETVWNNGNYGGGGGGISDLWSQPSWQRSSTVPGVNAAAQLQAASAFAAASRPDRSGAFCRRAGATGPCRQVPDVSLEADPTLGAVTVYNADWGGWTTVGGTSSSSPIWAAILADAASQVSCSGGVGFAAPALYAIASSPSLYSIAFNDVTKGSNDTGSNAGLYPGRSGYDMASGLGTPKVTGPDGSPALASLLCGGTGALLPLVATVSPGELDSSGNLVAVIHGDHLAQSGAGEVTSLQLGALRLSRQASASSTGFSVDSDHQISLLVSAADIAQISPGAPDASGAHAVVATTAGGSSSEASDSAQLLYAPSGGGGGTVVPVVSGVSPAGGAKDGGGEVTIFGAGFSGATGVSFGGVPTTFSVRSSTRIVATVPAYSGSTSCAATGTDPATDVCQVHVVVTGPGGSSAISPILAPAASVSVGCGCEAAPGLDEYDYFAPPTISSVAAVEDPLGFAGSMGGSLLTITGTGLSPFAITGALFGGPSDPGQWAEGSWSTSATELVVIAPAVQVSIEPSPATVRIATSATSPGSDPGDLGYVLSNPGGFSYAGIPRLSAISTRWGPTSGGTALSISGAGVIAATSVDFSGQVVFIGQQIGWATQTAIEHPDTSSIALQTPDSLPGPSDLYLCSASGCSDPSPAGVFTYYPPGDAVITGISPDHGPTAGGYRVTLSGRNLGCAKRIRVGQREITPKVVPALTGCGSTTRIRFTMREGRSGAMPAVSVLTTEGRATGSGWSAPVRFRFD